MRRPPELTRPASRGRLSPLSRSVLFIAMLGSCVVLKEPAPFDILITIWMGLFLTSGMLGYLSRYRFAILGASLIAVTTVIGFPFTPAENFNIRFTAISLYMIAIWFSLIFAMPRCGDDVGKAVVVGWTLSAFVTTAMSDIIYFFRLPGAEIVVHGGRMFGLFKDANVFTAALILPLLASITRSVSQRGWRRVFWVISAAVIASGLFLGYSRGAWISAFISLFALLGLTLISRARPGTSLRTLVAFSVGMLVISVLIRSLLENREIADFFAHRSQIQSYDSDRFFTQFEALDAFFSNPLGYGPGISERMFSRAIHNLYIRAMVENGAIGLFGLLVLLGSSIAHSTMTAIRSRYADPHANAAVICACLWGVAVESVVIDTLHWRHFWVLLALAWWVPSASTITRERGRAGADATARPPGSSRGLPEAVS